MAKVEYLIAQGLGDKTVRLWYNYGSKRLHLYRDCSHLKRDESYYSGEFDPETLGTNECLTLCNRCEQRKAKEGK